DPDTDLKKGAFKFRLAGEKLKGGWMLARLKGRPGDGDKEGWLFFKEHDTAMDKTIDILEARPESVKTGRRIEDLAAPPAPPPLKPGKLLPGKLAGARKAGLPAALDLQLAGTATEPPKSAGWLHEIKFDGYRTLAFVEGS